MAKGSDTVKIRLPRGRGEDETEFVSVNNRTWMVRRGEDVEVPRCVAEVFENRERALDQMYAYERKARDKNP